MPIIILLQGPIRTLPIAKRPQPSAACGCFLLASGSYQGQVLRRAGQVLQLLRVCGRSFAPATGLYLCRSSGG